MRVIPIACPFGTASTTYAYYVDAPRPALIDTGVAQSPVEVIGPALARIGVRLSDIRWILLTHGHWDHLGGARALLDITSGSAQVAIHDDDAALLRRPQAHVETYWGERFRFIDDPDGLHRAEAMVLENVAGEVAVHRVIRGGDRLSLGGDVTVTAVHTPGHTPGSVSFVLDGSATFTGDAVQICGSSGSSRFPLFSDPAAYRRSLRLLLDDVRPDLLYLGHRFLGPAGSMLEATLEGAAAKAALQESLDMEARIAAAAVVLPVGAYPHAWERFASAAAAFGLPAENPQAWPAAFIITLRGYAPFGAS